MRNGLFNRTFYILDDKGIVHRVKTRLGREIWSLESFRDQFTAHGYHVKIDRDYEHDLKVRSWSIGPVDHEVQHAFPQANGTFIDHASPRAFYDAIGYDAKTKRRCVYQTNKYFRDMETDDGAIRIGSRASYRVQLPGVAAQAVHT